jgi:hypothetical protein
MYGNGYGHIYLLPKHLIIDFIRRFACYRPDHNLPHPFGVLVKIDDTFIANYYSNNDNDKDLYKKLENKDDVLVVFPNAVNLTQEFCLAIKEFINLLRDNAVYREMLNQKATFSDYWVGIL